MREGYYMMQHWEPDDPNDTTGQGAFHYKQSMITWREDGKLYYAVVTERHTPDDRLRGQMIPIDALQPLAPSHLLVAQRPLPENSYVKAVNHCGFKVGQTRLAEQLLHPSSISSCNEAPRHRGIAEFLGYVEGEPGRIESICLKRYSRSLKQVVEAKENVDIDRIIPDNDVSLGNIVLDEDDRPVLVDFEACRLIGEQKKFITGSTGYSKTEGDLSVPENDFLALADVKRYLAGEPIQAQIDLGAKRRAMNLKRQEAIRAEKAARAAAAAAAAPPST